MFHVPFHSLVILDSTRYLHHFPSHEFIDTNVISTWMGQWCNLESLQNSIINIISSRLSLGGRVVLIETNQKQKEFYARYCEDNGIKIFIGDAEYLPINEINFYDFNGITIVGDVHGELNKLYSVLQWGNAYKNLFCFLGDIIDYGKDNIETINIVYSLVMSGKAIMIMGNHERKILKWAENQKAKLSDSNRITTTAINNLSVKNKRCLLNKFRALCARSRNIVEMDDFVLTHGAIHPSYWGVNKNSKAIERYSFYGESDTRSGVFKMTYNWIDHIPKGKTVIVGHDKRSNIAPLNISTSGGNAIFLDTGCGKGGQLTTANLKFEKNKLKLISYKSHS